MKPKKEKQLLINHGCSGCQKNCNYGLAVKDYDSFGLYGCNSEVSK